MSLIPVRRPGLSTRTLAAKKIENATATAPNARVKTIATTQTNATNVAAASIAQFNSRLTAPTAASKAKSVNAHNTKPCSNSQQQPHGAKRPALTEVTQHANNLVGDPKDRSTAGVSVGEGDARGRGKQVSRLVKAIESRVQAVPNKAQTKVIKTRTARAGHGRVPSNSTSTSSITVSTRSTSTTGATIGRREHVAKVKATKGVVEKLPKQTSSSSLSSKRRDDLIEEEKTNREAQRIFKKAHTSPPVAQLQRLNLKEDRGEEVRVAEELGKQLWEDLDANDWDDPQMVNEYVVDICKYWQECELRTLPRRDYMAGQKELTWEHRGIILDWMIRFHTSYPITHETIFLSINIMDRLLCTRQISPKKLSLLAAACFFIACKYEETIAPSITDMMEMGGDSWTERDLLLAEKHILDAINWDLSHPGPMGWLRRGSKADGNEVRARTLAKYLLEIGYMDWRLVGIRPSLLAAAALWFSRLVLGREDWTPTLEHYTTYSEKDLLPVASVMVSYTLRAPDHPNLFKKYSQKRYYQCSMFLRVWVTERWPENADIDLRDEVDLLKKEVRDYRASEEQKLQDTSEVF